MTIRLGSNIASLQAQRRLGEASSSLEKIYERLSSGQRINRASDDSAGLAIADDLNVKGRIFAQAIRNGNDGISVLNIADSAVENLSGIVTRIRELAEQSANGTYSSTQRKALDAEAQALSKEYTRVKSSTSFNGIKLFDGDLGDGLRLQLGFGVEGSIDASVGGAVGTGSFAAATSYLMDVRGSSDVVLGDLNGDGLLDIVTSSSASSPGYATVRLGTGNGSFGASTSYATGGFNGNSLSLGDLNGDGILDLVVAGDDTLFNGLAVVRLGIGDGTFGVRSSYATESDGSNALALGDLNGDGILDMVTAGSDDFSDGYATVRLGTGSGSFGTAISFSTESHESHGLRLGDLNRDGFLDIITAGTDTTSGNTGYATIRLGTGTGSFGSSTSFLTENGYSSAVTLGDLNGDDILDLVTAGRDDSSIGYATVRLGTGSGSFGASTSFVTESNGSNSIELGDLDGDGILDLITAGTGFTGTFQGYATIRVGSGAGTFGAATSYTTESRSSSAVRLGDINDDGVYDLVTSGTTLGASDGFATIRLGESKDGISPLLTFSLKTKTDALLAISTLTKTQNNLLKQRGVIGANQSRVEIAISSLISSKENFAAAESRIRDADVAADAAELVRTQILQQAATSILAQANQAPALALKLLTP